MTIDKSWMQIKNTYSDEYGAGLKKFLDFAFSHNTGNAIRCPCKKCKNVLIKTRTEVELDLVKRGFMDGYNRWTSHGEDHPELMNLPVVEDHRPEAINDDMYDMICDAIGIPSMSDMNIGASNEHVEEEPNEEARKFFSLLSDAKMDLYPDCKEFSKLSFLVKLLNIKSRGKWSNKSFDMLLELLHAAFPKDHHVPKSYYESKKITRALGFSYEKIDACVNDCVLFWKTNSKETKCPVCGAPRWKSDSTTEDNDGDDIPGRKSKKVANKILRYFPLKPRLQRLFMSTKTASSMRWHYEERPNDGVLRHPADAQVWKDFDKEYVEFASDPRNVRLALASDGMNPFGNMSVSYSTWPVVVIPYNLPPWLCMKQSNFILSALIEGPRAPGNDIDVYLQPMVDELNELWETGVETYDASKKKNFQLHAAMLWTINDFPAYANLSGWSTKGKLACPCCMEETESCRLKNGGKFCYMGHRRFLPEDHEWRNQKNAFDGKKELRPAPKLLSGLDVYNKLSKFEQVSFGKGDKKKRKADDEVTLPGNWKKMSIFFQLPYHKSIQLRHCLDPMHIEKNVLDILLGTLMNVTGKSKDNLKARLDLMAMGIRKELHPKKVGDKYSLPHACYMLLKNEKQLICNNWKDVKVPDGYSSNISRCVNTKERKISGLKSHDCHVLLQTFLPLAIRGMLEKHVCDAVIELGFFFRALCSKVLRVDELDELQEQIRRTLCKLERIFPPSFFVVMMHLPIHLPYEAKLGGPIQFRGMYSTERFLKTLKQYVRNTARPEGSIAEGYLVDEMITFCSRYLDGTETKFNRQERNYDGYDEEPLGGFSIFERQGRGLKNPYARQLSDDEWKQARLYVLNNCDEAQPFIEEHKAELAMVSNTNIEARHAEEFPDWLLKRVSSMVKEGSDQASEDLISLANFPRREVICYRGFKINGFRFHTKDLEQRRVTQNSGVMVKADDLPNDMCYYGVLKDVVELKYRFDRRVVLFKCDWWDVLDEGDGFQKDEYEILSVNKTRNCYADQPFVLASQAQQVFYVNEIRDSKWFSVVETKPRDFYDLPNKEVGEENEESSDSEAYQETTAARDLLRSIIRLDDDIDMVAWKRLDIPEEEILYETQPQGHEANTSDFIDDEDDYISEGDEGNETDLNDDADDDDDYYV